MRSGNVAVMRWFAKACPNLRRERAWWFFGHHDVLYSKHGTPITSGRQSLWGADLEWAHGHSLSWSSDGRWLLAVHHPTGTCVVGYSSLHALAAADRIRDGLLGERMVDRPLVGKDGLILFVRYDEADGYCDDPVDASSTLYVGRLLSD